MLRLAFFCASAGTLLGAVTLGPLEVLLAGPALVAGSLVLLGALLRDGAPEVPAPPAGRRLELARLTVLRRLTLGERDPQRLVEGDTEAARAALRQLVGEGLAPRYLLGKAERWSAVAALARAFFAAVLVSLVVLGLTVRLSQGEVVAVGALLVVAFGVDELASCRGRTSVVVRGDRVEQREQEAEVGQDVADQHRRS